LRHLEKMGGNPTADGRNHSIYQNDTVTDRIDTPAPVRERNGRTEALQPIVGRFGRFIDSSNVAMFNSAERF